MSSIQPKLPPDLNAEDDYYKKVIGDIHNILIISNRQDAHGNPDEVANREATVGNLTRETDRLSSLVAEQSSSIPLTEACQKLLTDVRSLMSAAQLDPYVVQGKFDEIKYRLLRAYASRKVWWKWFAILLFSNLFYLVGIIGLIVWKMLIPGQPILEQPAYVVLACALWGGMGGVVDALFALHTHFSNQDFDLQYRPWYLLHPLQGSSLGVVIFLLMQAGLMAVSDKSLAEPEPTSSGVAQVGVTALPIAMAFLAGFKQNAAYEFIGRVVKSVFQKD